jgi:peptidoglycan hydrolase CwlO-like protein
MVKSPRNISVIEKVTTWIGSLSSLILHSVFFVLCFLLSILKIIELNTMLLVLTTVVSLEAIYLAIFIQMTVNRNTESLREVEEDIDEIQEDVEELGEDVDEIQEDIEEMSEDVEEMQEDLGELQEDIEEMTEEEIEEEKQNQIHSRSIEALTADIRKILVELEAVKKPKKK